VRRFQRSLQRALHRSRQPLEKIAGAVREIVTADSENPLAVVTRKVPFPSTPMATEAAAKAREPSIHPTLEQSAFAANLWHTPPGPAPVTVAKAPEPPKPLNVQLIGIINEAGVRKAALYDMETDRLVIVSDGDSIRGHTIKSITEKTIELTDGRSSQTLTLADPASGGRS
jgi:hypothetical protein